jgi:dipeptidyl aminopeptidase/acylaminoacyl peptidase
MARRITESDIARIKFVSDPRISPDGSYVAWVVTDVVEDEKRYQSRIWLSGTGKGSESREFTRGNSRDTSPRWSPDGLTLAFLRNDSGTNQIYTVNVCRGEPSRVTDVDGGVSWFDWTSSGRGFLFVAKGDQNHHLQHETKSDDEPDDDDDPSNEPRRITTLAHRADGEGYRDGRRNQIGIALLSGRIVQLTTGDYDHGQPALSPCRQYLAFASNQSENRDNERRTDIWMMDLEMDTTRRITDHDGVYGQPVFSPDSSKLAFTGHPVQSPFGPVNLDRIWIADIGTGSVDCLSSSIDREMSNTCSGDSSYGVPEQRVVWSDDSASIYSLVSDRGDVGIVEIGSTGAWDFAVRGDREVMNFSVGSDGQIAFTASDPTHPAEVFLRGESGNERQLSNHNREWLSEVATTSPIHMPYQMMDGTQIDAWLLEPVDRREGVRYPLVLEIHGGPHAMYGNTFFHEFQLLAAQGYAVLYTNPRGSTGYGQEFGAAAMGDWGGTDYQDVMAGLDAALERFDWIDSRRLGVTGGSYGGYLVNWIVTQTDRFAAAITQRSTCNRKNLFGSSDLVWTYSEWEFRTLPWEDPDFYYDRSPLSHVDRVKTPILIMHSENDLRCPIEQGEQWFTALKRLGKTTEFVRFPGESHNLSRSGRPDRRVERLKWMTGWLGKHL